LQIKTTLLLQKVVPKFSTQTDIIHQRWQRLPSGHWHSPCKEEGVESVFISFVVLSLFHYQCVCMCLCVLDIFENERYKRTYNWVYSQALSLFLSLSLSFSLFLSPCVYIILSLYLALTSLKLLHIALWLSFSLTHNVPLESLLDTHH